MLIFIILAYDICGLVCQLWWTVDFAFTSRSRFQPQSIRIQVKNRFWECVKNKSFLPSFYFLKFGCHVSYCSKSRVERRVHRPGVSPFCDSHGLIGNFSVKLPTICMKSGISGSTGIPPSSLLCHFALYFLFLPQSDLEAFSTYAFL